MKNLSAVFYETLLRRIYKLKNRDFKYGADADIFKKIFHDGEQFREENINVVKLHLSNAFRHSKTLGLTDQENEAITNLNQKLRYIATIDELSLLIDEALEITSRFKQD